MRPLKAVGDREVDAELSRRVEAARPVEEPPEPPPAPQVPGRPAALEEIARCASARNALANATKAGWTAWLSYAQGPLLGANGQVLEHPVESLVLRARKGSARLVAAWLCRPSQTAPHKKTAVMTEKWALDFAYVSPGDGTWTAIGGNEIKTHLEAA